MKIPQSSTVYIQSITAFHLTIFKSASFFSPDSRKEAQKTLSITTLQSRTASIFPGRDTGTVENCKHKKNQTYHSENQVCSIPANKTVITTVIKTVINRASIIIPHLQIFHLLEESQRLKARFFC